MFAKLISLLLHAKSGAISGVFLLGATGALVSVSATTNNGVTTIVLTEASASPSHSASPSASPTATPTHTTTPTASPSPSTSTPSSPSSTACTDEAKALAFQVQRVDSAFSGFHTDLMKLRAERDAATVAKADATLQLVRQAATKAIHATATVTCAKTDDENDNDENDNDDQDQQGDNNGDHQNGSDNDNKDKSAVPAATVTALSVIDEGDDAANNDGGGKKLDITFTGGAAAIADQAIAAMQAAFDAAKNAPAKTPKPSASHKPEASKSPKPSSSAKGEHHD